MDETRGPTGGQGGGAGGGAGDGSNLGAAAGPPSERASRWAELAADLVLANEVLPGPASLPGLDTLRARYARRQRVRRFGFGVFSLATAAALGTVALMAISGRYAAPVSYVVDGASRVEANTIEAAEAPRQSGEAGQAGRRPAAKETRVRFSEGTEIALAAGTRLRVPARTAVGADLILDRGRASFAVVHRPTAKWRVMAGPFVVDVTGTRFSLEWATNARRMTLELESGGVIVRGDAAGPGVAVGPGERLVASTIDGRVTVQRAETSARSASGRASGSEANRAADAAQADQEERAEQMEQVDAAGQAGAEAFASLGTVAHPPRPTPAGGAVPSRPSSRSKGLRVSPLDLAIASPTRAVGRSSQLEPPPVLAPSAPSLVMGGGGVFCAGERAELGFETADTSVSVPPWYHTAFSGPRPDATHSWCGTRSQRVNVAFTEQGRRNFMGRLPNQSGQVVIRLPRTMDFTDKTVSLHMFIEGPSDARVAAQLFVVHHGKWVNGPVVDDLVPRRWWTISHTFRAENQLTVGPPYPPGGTSRVTDCDRIALIVYSTGGPRTWSGALYVDEVGWR